MSLQIELKALIPKHIIGEQSPLSDITISIRFFRFPAEGRVLPSQNLLHIVSAKEYGILIQF